MSLLGSADSRMRRDHFGKQRFEQTIFRRCEQVNEGLRDDPEVTIEARALRLTPDGDLYIEQDDVRKRMFGATTWGSFTVKRVR